MLFVFLVDTSVSMGQELNTSLCNLSHKRRDEQLPQESLFANGGGSEGEFKARINRRWQRKGLGATSLSSGLHKNTRLDCAKSIVEQIISNRQNFDQDRYMLVTYSDGSHGCIRSNLKDTRATFISELRKLEAKDKFHGGVALTSLFNQLSLMRGAYDMDTYGYGRYPALNEPVQIVWLTDGGSIVTPAGIKNKLNLPVTNTPWLESYVEPFRWDQRLVLVLLHEQGDSQLCVGKKHSSENTLMPMCSVMGGTTHHVGSMAQAHSFVEAFTPTRAAPNSMRSQGSAASTPGVLVNFERIDDNPANSGNSDLRVLLHAPPNGITSAPLPPPTDTPAVPPQPPNSMNGPARGQSQSNYGNSAGVSAMINGHLGYFPIPEAFWPEAIVPPRAPGAAPGSGAQSSQSQGQPAASGGNWQIQRRSAHPTLGYSQVSTEWTVPVQFPFDKFQIDTNCNVAQKLLAATQAAQTAHEAQGGKGPAKPVCWPVFVNGSYTTPKNSGFPFGILRANTARTAVNLYILPYNFTALWKILSKLDIQVQQGQYPNRTAAAMAPGWRREFEEYLQHTPGYYAIPLKRAFNLYGVPHSVFPKTFGQSSGMRSITHYSLRLHNVSRKEWDRLHPGSGVEGPGPLAPMEQAFNLQQSLVAFTPASDVTHLVPNAFDVDRAHCLATLSAMRRVFVRECMSSQSAYFRANAVVPPSALQASSDSSEVGSGDMDVDDEGVPQSPSPFTPPVASIEYSMFGYSQGLDGPGTNSSQLSSYGARWLGQGGPSRQQQQQQRGSLDLELQQLEPGLQLSRLGGLVDVASEDDRDSRHSVPIREMGEFGAIMNRIRSQEARDPLQDERQAMQQRRNMFGNPYRRPLRELRGPGNNVLARNPELSAKLGLGRPPSKTPAPMAGAAGSNGNGQQKMGDSEDDGAAATSGSEMESEAEVNDLAIDKMIEDMPIDDGEGTRSRDVGGQNNGGGRFWWLQRKDVPRRRSINTPWRKNDTSWNVNPWATPVPGSLDNAVAEPGTLTYTADSFIIHKGSSQIVRPDGSQSAANSAAPSPVPGSFSEFSDGRDIDGTQSTSTGSEAEDNVPSTQETAAHKDAEEAGLAVEKGGEKSTNAEPASIAVSAPTTAPAADASLDIPMSEMTATGSEMAVDAVSDNSTKLFEVSEPSKATAPPQLETQAEAQQVPAVPKPVPATVHRRVNVAEEKAWFLKRVKAEPAHYDEDAILEHLAELKGNPTLGKPQLKIIVNTAVTAAKAMRRKQLVLRLEESAAKS
ncbi:hypothetical protein GGI07_002130 [Coemansia sp. Benny D115]|nr:hypothetical protein GGI07_002130 [Coemansia sp. Benny D115]